MIIAETYEAKQGDLVITYKLRDMDQDFEIYQKIEQIDADPSLGIKEKNLKLYNLILEEITDIKGLKRSDGSEVTLEDVRALRIPAIFMRKLQDIYKTHKAQLLGVPEAAAKKA